MVPWKFINFAYRRAIMKKHSKSALIVVAIALILVSLYFIFSDGAEEEVVVVQETCDIVTKLPDKDGFVKKVDTQSAVYTKIINGVDGQKIGFERHTMSFDEEKCSVTETVTEKEIFGERLVNFPGQGRSEFYKDDVLIYKDTALLHGMWLREYTETQNIPEKIPNWASPSGEDLYMTLVVVAEGKVSRLPVWGLKAVWIKTDDKDYTLMAGKVGLKNPSRGLTSEEIYTVIRYDQSSSVNYLGLLFPTSETTFNSYLSYLLSENDSWKKATEEEDVQAAKDYFDGPVKLSKKNKVSLEEGFRQRKTQVRYVPSVPKGFTPAVDALPTLF